MFTSWDQVKEWITDNGFKRWIFYTDSSRKDKIIDSKAFTISDIEDKLAMTEKYLKKAGGEAFGCGFPDNGSNMETATVCRLRIESAQPTSGIGGSQDFGMMADQLRKSITAEVEAKWKEKEYERERKEFEEKKKQFEADKSGVMGVLVDYIAPYLPIINQAKQSRLVAGTHGIDARQPVHTQPIIPEDGAQDPDNEAPEAQEPTIWDQFTEEEATEILTLVVRFKAAEPDFMKMLRKVVTMAENGDAMYGMAKGFLTKED